MKENIVSKANKVKRITSNKTMYMAQGMTLPIENIV